MGDEKDRKVLPLDQIPASVYRVQFSSECDFQKAITLLPYLQSLGIEAIYCSPYFQSGTGHGYDITNPNQINSHLGGWPIYELFCQELKKTHLKQIVDVVPNHMGINSAENLWWYDVLENGPYSEYAYFFDVDWNPEKKELQNRILLPVLADCYGLVLEEGEIQLAYNAGGFELHYNAYPLPVTPPSYCLILEQGIETLKAEFEEEDPDWHEYQLLVELYRFFPLIAEKRRVKKAEGKERLKALVERSEKCAHHLRGTLQHFNGTKRDARSFDALDQLLEAQAYRLSYWKVASHEINYRRFFNIHELASIRIEEETVFHVHHRLLFELIESGLVHGLRIDHPDGLYDPVTYFERLRAQAPLLTVVEKILDGKETLPSNWQVEGTVGYEYLNVLNQLFVEPENAEAFTEIYEEFIGEKLSFDECVYRAKKQFTFFEMRSEVAALGLKLDRLSESDRAYRDFTRYDLTAALGEVIAAFPVYRTYISPSGPMTAQDTRAIHFALQKAKENARDLDLSLFEFLEKLLLLKLPTEDNAISKEPQGYRDFVLRFQQLTAPIMAKGVEDTAFYLYNRLISLNEVGGDPTHFGDSSKEFHRHNSEKRLHWPYGFLASSTHDTKRSEDVRARLNVLSEMPVRWKEALNKWAQLNARHKSSGWPSANTEYFIYQTLLGIWPNEHLKNKEYEHFCHRIWQSILKSLREAKQETHWTSAHLGYEAAVEQFFFAILSREKGNPFLNLFTEFHREIDRCGSYNSLSQTLLKIGSPGIVDIYQGNELLHYCLVDPDNRQAVDFELRRSLMAALPNVAIDTLFATHELSRLKLFLHQKALHFRKLNKALFLQGNYIPLRVRGERSHHVIAFLRQHEEQLLLVLAARFFSKLLSSENELPLGNRIWGETEVIIPHKMASELTDLFTGKHLRVEKRGNDSALNLATVFEQLPVSYLYTA